jgi:ATP-binding cassette subfamily B protein
MRLLRDLWATSPYRTGMLACLVVLGAAGQAVASALAGPVLSWSSGRARCSSGWRSR